MSQVYFEQSAAAGALFHQELSVEIFQFNTPFVGGPGQLNKKLPCCRVGINQKFGGPGLVES
jgi:hypothetical protein